jgi:hypothetical protein
MEGEDGFHVDRNMLERFYLFYNVLITLRFLTLSASVGNKKCSKLFNGYTVLYPHS